MEGEHIKKIWTEFNTARIMSLPSSQRELFLRNKQQGGVKTPCCFMTESTVESAHHLHWRVAIHLIV
jgi:hypothetical protein